LDATLHFAARMKNSLMLLFALVAALPARAETVIWFDSGFLTSVDDPSRFPGLTVGTPWSMQWSFDTNAPQTPGFGTTPAMGCGFSAMGSSTLTLGSYTYTSSGGRVWTNSNLPGDNCLRTVPPSGVIQFEWLVDWAQEPGAWDLNGGPGLLIAGYTDAIFRSGTLPSSPTLSGLNTGLSFFSLDGPFPSFQDHTFAPMALDAAPVPEPATLTLFATGLAYLARRRYRGNALSR
jgi:hypothetical protein